MKYFVIMQTPNGDLYAKCFDSYVEVADYVKSITYARWGLFQWRESHLFWLKGSSFKDIPDLTSDIYVNEILVDEIHSYSFD